MSKITLESASDVGLDKLVASDANVRRIKAGVSVEDLAEDIGVFVTLRGGGFIGLAAFVPATIRCPRGRTWLA
jgi:hypothetical protein